MVSKKESWVRGFTLVEVMLVIVILGVLASLVVGQFQGYTQSAAEAATKQDLHTLRTAIERYHADHGSYPSNVNITNQLTQYTDAAGNCSPTRTSTHVKGPYLQEIAVLKVGTNEGSKLITSVNLTPGFGWCYYQSNGYIHVNAATTELDTDGVAILRY